MQWVPCLELCNCGAPQNLRKAAGSIEEKISYEVMFFSLQVTKLGSRQIQWRVGYAFPDSHFPGAQVTKHGTNIFILFVQCKVIVPSVLWRCWLAGRKGIRPVKNWVLVWLSVWSEVQTCILPSWCHCHSLSLASVKSRSVLPFWYWLTWVIPEKDR